MAYIANCMKARSLAQWKVFAMCLAPSDFLTKNWPTLNNKLNFSNRKKKQTLVYTLFWYMYMCRNNTFIYVDR